MSSDDRLLRYDLAGTAALVCAAAAGAAAPDSLAVVTVVVAGVLFVVGVVTFLWGFGIGVGRSREEQITLGGLFFLSHTAPRAVRMRFRLALAVQVVVSAGAASIRPYTAVAFAVLAPMYGLGLMALWGARHGRFFGKDETSEGRSDAAAAGADQPESDS